MTDQRPWQSAKLAPAPPFEKWDDWVEYESRDWPAVVKRHYRIVPSLCFNCEAACGILAYVEKETYQVRKIEGNPLHPGSRGKLCAKGAVTPNQLEDPDRILYPMKRKGPRGGGQWERVSWETALEEIGGRMRRLYQDGRQDEIMYHIGRPGEDGHVMRVLAAWGLDGHNSHTNVCSSSARLGYLLWTGADRPSPDWENARTILMLTSHLESGHYFNPHAQRIMTARARGAKLITIDPRLSNSASKSDLWLAPYSGTESAIFLAIARWLVETGRYNRPFVERWWNWEEYLAARRPDAPRTFDAFAAAFLEEYAEWSFEAAARESGVKARDIAQAAEWVAEAGTAFATHSWRSAASGNLWGWQITRCISLLTALTGSLGTKGGVHLAPWNKLAPKHPNPVAPPAKWNELLFPREFPLACYELSFLLPHFLKEGRGRIGLYITRVFNPVWTYPDGFSWIEALTDESKIECHVALTPTWSESAWYADYVLPMGLATERHDNQSQETHDGRWVGFRQPVVRVAMEADGRKVSATHQANPGEVWEHNEFWIELTWRADADGALGIRKHFESPYRPGQKITVDEYYRWMFENGTPGLPEKAAAAGMTPLEYMRRHGVFGIETPPGDALERHKLGTPSGKLEFYSKTMVDWGWERDALPVYRPGHVHWKDLKRDQGELDLLPNFRLPTLIHTRSAVKWLYEISHSNPLWVNPEDARRARIATGQLVRVTTRIGYFVTRAWVTEGIRPGVLGMSHHLGRWRLSRDSGVARLASALVTLERAGKSRWLMRQVQGVVPFQSADPDTGRVFWREAGVNQNLTFPVQPDPVSGMHCWHQKVRLSPAEPEDQYGDISVDTEESHKVYKEWMEQCRPAQGPLRRPLWLPRPGKPPESAYRMP